VNLLLAAGDIVSHLSDYPIPGLGGFTAHHAILISVSLLMILVFGFAARQAATEPKKTGLTALIEVGLVWVRDEIVYPWLGPEMGRKWLFFFWTLFFFILTNNLIGLMPAPINMWGRTATGNINVTFTLAVIAFCADIGHWATSGLQPLDVVRKIAPRVHAFHMKDRFRSMTFIKAYQKDRIESWLFKPGQDPLDRDWNKIQSEIAIGSGGLTGKGWGKGTQNTHGALPERHTDFVFSNRQNTGVKSDFAARHTPGIDN